jgi:hypothetical protein
LPVLQLDSDNAQFAAVLGDLYLKLDQLSLAAAVSRYGYFASPWRWQVFVDFGSMARESARGSAVPWPDTPLPH